MGFGLVRYSARASITLDQLAEQGSGLNQREGAGEENRDRDKRSRWMSVDRKGGRQRRNGRFSRRGKEGEEVVEIAGYDKFRALKIRQWKVDRLIRSRLID